MSRTATRRSSTKSLPAPIVKTEAAAVATRKAIGTGRDYLKAGGILAYCFTRTLFTGRTTK